MQLLRGPTPGLLYQAAKPVKGSLDAALDGDGGMAVLAGELCTGNAFDFELNQEMAFFSREPSLLLRWLFAFGLT